MGVFQLLEAARCFYDQLVNKWISAVTTSDMGLLQHVEIVGFGVGLMSRLHTRRLRRFQFYRHDWALGRLYMCCRLGRQRGRAGGSRGGCEQRWTKVSCNCKLTMVITIMLMMAMCEQR